MAVLDLSALFQELFQEQPPSDDAATANDALLPLEIRWASTAGWLAVRDPFTGAWHELAARACPPSWKDAAWQTVERQRLERSRGQAWPTPIAARLDTLWYAD